MPDGRAALNHDEALELGPGFVLGALEPEEAAAVRSHLASCDEAHPTIDDLAFVAPALLESVELVEPPPTLRRRILEAAAARDAESVTVLPQPASVAQGPTEAGRRSAPRFRLVQPSWIAAAVAAILVVALGAQAIQLRAELDAAQAYQDGVAAVLETAGGPGGQLAALAGAEPGGPIGLAATDADGRVVIAMRGLPATRGAEVYEAWLIAGDGAPVPAGSFTVSSDGTAAAVLTRAPSAPGGAVVALTREPGPGAVSPTLPILAQGVARGASG